MTRGLADISGTPKYREARWAKNWYGKKTGERREKEGRGKYGNKKTGGTTGKKNNLSGQ